MLSIRDLRLAFGRISVLNGVTLDLGSGEVLTLIGANGAGKSTTLRAIAGLAKPHGGRILLDGDDILGRSCRDIVRAGLTLVPQGRQLFGAMTVRENIEMGAFTRHAHREITSEMDRWLAFFPEAQSWLPRRAAQLSGGQQQIVALIRGLMARPRVLLLDEPSMGVAPIGIAQMGRELRRLCSEAGITILLVEQNVTFALDVADRVAVLAQGRDVYAGPPDELRNPEVLAGFFFGVNEAASANGPSSRH